MEKAVVGAAAFLGLHPNLFPPRFCALSRDTAFTHFPSSSETFSFLSPVTSSACRTWGSIPWIPGADWVAMHTLVGLVVLLGGPGDFTRQHFLGNLALSLD